jgi:hypothetical protein
MGKLKPHKTVEQIAKKHRLDVSFIQKQLDMGEPIEHEHTKDHKLAMDIALQHLDEIPDYYTRLKKMEASAKKEHKKFKDVKEYADVAMGDVDSPVHMPPMNGVHVDYEKRYCPKCKKTQLRSECKYGPRYWDLFSLPEKLKEENKSGDEGLHDWFNKSKSSDGKKGWVQLGGKWAGKPCARQPGQTSTPKCGSSKISANLSDEEEERARRRKNRLDPNQPEKTGGEKPTNVRTEEMDLKEVKDKPNKGSGKKDACYNKVKSRYDVWPSAYASGALVKCRKVGAANWGTKSEETMHEEERFCPLCDKRETRSECSYGEKAWDKVSIKDHEYSMIRSELETLMSAAKRLQAKVGKGEGNVEAWVQSKITKAADYIDTAADYVSSGEMEESVGFTIDPSVHKKAQKREKIRNVAVKGSTQGERSAASGKLGSTTELPSIKKEEKIVDKIVDEMKCWSGYKKKGTQELFGKKYNRCVKKENVTIEDADGNTFAEVIDLIKPEPIKGFKSQVEESTRMQSQTGNVVVVTLTWRGKYYSLKMFFPQVKLPTRKEINDELQKVYPGSKVIYHSVSEIQPGQPLIQAFGPQGGSSAKPGPNRNYVKPMGEEVEVDEDWQKVNRQDKTDGLSPEAVKAYRRENPGSKLKTAVTTPPSELKPGSADWKRRRNFCSRSRSWTGERGKAARKRWNCN